MTVTGAPRCGLLSSERHDGPVVGFDVSKAYTECMSLITHRPVFSVFDVMIPCDHDCDVSPLSFYVVYVEDLDPILFPQSWDFVPGLTVTFAREHGIKVETHGVITPYRHIASGGLEALWGNSEL